MSTPGGARIVTDPSELEAFFADQRAAHIYALVDLEPPYWAGSRWYRRGEAVVGVVALGDGDAIAVYAVSTRDPKGSVALLGELAAGFATGQLITGPCGMDAALAAVRPVTSLGRHLRYRLADPTAVPAPGEIDAFEHRRVAEVVALDRRHVAEITALYDTEPDAAFFMPHMLDDDAFVGVRRHDELVAVAGTHVVSERQGVAAIGGVFTRADHRGRGLGRVVTAGVIGRLAGRVETIGLNVHADNGPARAVYESLGFVALHAYAESVLA